MKYYVNDYLLDSSHLFPFLEDSRWQPTTDLKQADVLPMLCHTDDEDIAKQRDSVITAGLYNFRGVSLLMSVYHADEAKDSVPFAHTCLDKDYAWLPSPKLYVHTNMGLDDPRCVFYDILLARTQAMFAHHRWDLLGTHWLEHAEPYLFALTDIPNQKQLENILLIPARVYDNNSSMRMHFRRELLKFSSKKIAKQTLYTGKAGEDLPAEHTNPQQSHYLKNKSGSIWQPIKNSIYNTSLASAYIETVSVGPCRVITEKTWDPIVKGHFILPFSYPEIIDDLESFGIRFPDFIRYDYLEIDDLGKRWLRYQKELERLCETPRARLQTSYEKNQYILEHNRHAVLSQPVTKLYDSVVHRCSHLLSNSSRYSTQIP